MARRMHAWCGAVLATAALLAGCTAPTDDGATPSPTTSGSPVASATAPATSPATASATAPAPSSSPDEDGGTDATPPAGSGGTSLPEPTVVSAARASDGAVEVAGLVPGVVQNGGTCTATVTVGGDEHSASVEALADVSSTTCGTIRVPAPAGPATARLAYRDATGASVTSPSVEVAP